MNKWMIVSIMLVMLTACDKEIDEVIVEPIDGVYEEQVPEQEKMDLPVFNRGQISENVYSNDFFDVSYGLPDGWVVLTIAEVDAIMNLGERLTESDTRESLGTSNVYSLMGVFKYPVDHKVSMNPSMIISAEEIEPSSNIRDGLSYLENSKEILVNTGIPYKVIGDVRSVEVDDTVYGVMDVSIDAGELIIGQTYYAFYSKGYIVNILMTYTERDGMKELQTVIGD